MTLGPGGVSNSPQKIVRREAHDMGRAELRVQFPSPGRSQPVGQGEGSVEHP